MLTNFDLLYSFQDENVTLLWRWKPLFIMFCKHCDSVAHLICGLITLAGIGWIRQVDALREFWAVYINFTP